MESKEANKGREDTVCFLVDQSHLKPLLRPSRNVVSCSPTFSLLKKNRSSLKMSSQLSVRPILSSMSVRRLQLVHAKSPLSVGPVSYCGSRPEADV